MYDLGSLKDSLEDDKPEIVHNKRCRNAVIVQVTLNFVFKDMKTFWTRISLVLEQFFEKLLFSFKAPKPP